MRVFGRWRGQWAILFLAAAVGVHGAVWVWMTEQIRAGADALAAEYAAQGWHVTAGAPSRGGWPLAARLRYPGVTVSGAADWTAEQVDLQIPLTRPGTLEIIPGGAQTLAVSGLPPLRGEAGRLVIATPLDGVGPMDVAGSDVTLALEAGPLAIRTVSARLTDADITADVRGVRVPAGWRLMDGDIEQAGFQATLTPPWPVAGALAQRASVWRGGGGVLRVSGMVLRWGALGVNGAGEMRLDGRLQPEGEAGLQVSGYAAALDGAVRAGLLPARTAVAAKAVLGLLAAPAHGGPVSVPVQLRDGVVSAARFPLLRVPGLDWGAL